MSLQTSPLTGQALNSVSGGDGPSAKKQRTQNAKGQGDQMNDSQCPDQLDDSAAEQQSSAEAQDGSKGEAGPQLTEDFDSMTDTVKAGIYMMQTRTQAVDEKVDMHCWSIQMHDHKWLYHRKTLNLYTACCMECCLAWYSTEQAHLSMPVYWTALV